MRIEKGLIYSRRTASGKFKPCSALRIEGIFVPPNYTGDDPHFTFVMRDCRGRWGKSVYRRAAKSIAEIENIMRRTRREPEDEAG